MKIRNGFVSNSSSSSFVVAFPKKPKSFEGVYEMMFNSKEGGIQPYEYIDGMSHAQVARRVWEDIMQKYVGKTSQNTIALLSAQEKEIVKLFADRYYDTRYNDGSENIGGYYGNDKESHNKLMDLIVKTEDEEKKLDAQLAEIFRREFKIPTVKYACKGGKDFNTNKPYTNAEVKAYESYAHAENKFREENKEYAPLCNKRTKLLRKKYKQQNILQNKIAKADAKVFMNDNKKAFIVILSYSDNKGETILEHGNIFKNLSYVQVSHH